MDEPITYMFDGMEVVLTGRVAERTLRNGKLDIQHEIKPADIEEGTFTRWIRFKELYTITHDNS